MESVRPRTKEPTAHQLCALLEVVSPRILADHLGDVTRA